MLCLCQAIRLFFSKRSRRHNTNVYELDAYDNEIKPDKYSLLVSEDFDDEATQINDNNTTEHGKTNTPTLVTQPICHIPATLTPRMLESFIKQQGQCTHIEEVELGVDCGEKAGTGTWPVSREMSRKVEAILKHADKIVENVEVANGSGVEARETRAVKSNKDDSSGDISGALAKKQEKKEKAAENDAGITMQYQYYRPRLSTIHEIEPDTDAESEPTRSHTSITNEIPTNDSSSSSPNPGQTTTNNSERIYTLPNTTSTSVYTSTADLNTQESVQRLSTLGSIAAESPEDKAKRVKERLDRARELLAQIRSGEYKGKYGGKGYVLKEKTPGEDGGDCDVGSGAGEMMNVSSDQDSISSSVLEEVNADSAGDSVDEGSE